MPAKTPPALDDHAIRLALETFVSCIELTGGVVTLPGGQDTPVADLGWYDLGETYVKACVALGRKPRVRKARAHEIEGACCLG